LAHVEKGKGKGLGEHGCGWGFAKRTERQDQRLTQDPLWNLVPENLGKYVECEINLHRHVSARIERSRYVGRGEELETLITTTIEIFRGQKGGG